MSSERTVTDVENSLPFLIYDNLGGYHTMDPEVRQDPSSTSTRSNLPGGETIQPRDEPHLVQDDRPRPNKKYLDPGRV